nr:zinc finger protein 681-like [Anopheles coluzzii]
MRKSSANGCTASASDNQVLEPPATPANKATEDEDDDSDSDENPSHLTIACPECGKMFADRSGLRRHESVHTKDKPYLCEKCSRSFTQKTSLVRHMLIHLREKNFPCTHCTMKFRQRVNLDAHVKQVHPPADDPELENRFHCKKCPSAFKTAGRLRDHRARLHGEMVIFDQCVKRTPNVTKEASEGSEDSDEASQEEDSQSSAQDTEQEDSEIVQKVIPSRRTEHLKGKTPQRRHECEVCKAAFLKKAHLAQHMVSHLGFKEFRCDVCDKTFSTKQSLNSHTVLHAQTELPFSCDACGESFSRRATLKRHQTMLHEEQKHSYRCPYCGKRCRWYHNCLTHIKRFHPKTDGKELLDPIKEPVTNGDHEETVPLAGNERE